MLHHKDAHDTRNQVDRQYDQRKQNPLHAEHRIKRRTQNHRAHILRGGRLKDVRSTARAVTDVVTHQVRNHSRVPRIVLRDSRLDLTHQVRAHIRGLRIDSTAKLRKQRHQRSSKAKPDQLVRHLLRVLQPAEEQEQRTHTQQRKRHHHQSRNRAAPQRHLQCLIQTRPRRRRRPDIRSDRAVHSRIPSEARAHRTYQETDHRLQGIGRRPRRHVVSHKHHNCQSSRNLSDRRVLAPQKRLGPLTDRIRNRPHLRRPRIRCDYRTRQHQRRHQRQNSDHKGNPQIHPAVVLSHIGRWYSSLLLNGHCQKANYIHANVSLQHKNSLSFTKAAIRACAIEEGQCIPQYMLRCALSCTADQLNFTKSTNQSNSTARPFLTKIPSQPMHTSAQQRGIAVSIQRNFVLDSPALRELVAGVISRRALRLTFLLALSLTRFGLAQIDTSSVAPHRYLVLYRNATIPGDAEAHVASAGAHLIRRNEHFGIAAVESAIARGRRQHPAPPCLPTQRRLRPSRPHRLRPSPPPSGHHSGLQSAST